VINLSYSFILDLSMSTYKVMIKTLLLIVFSFISFPLAAAEVRLAVASNFVPTMRVLSDSFEKNTGHTVIISSGSSGKFVAQIMQGAKYDLFFSADQLKVEALIKKGLADAESQWTYALGTLALWSNKELFFKNEDAIKRLETLNFNKLAIANPRLAPYGQAAEQTLDMLGLLEKTQGKLVFGENVSQAFQFVQTNNADIGPLECTVRLNKMLYY